MTSFTLVTVLGAGGGRWTYIGPVPRESKWEKPGHVYYHESKVFFHIGFLFSSAMCGLNLCLSPQDT